MSAERLAAAVSFLAPPVIAASPAQIGLLFLWRSQAGLSRSWRVRTRRCRA